MEVWWDGLSGIIRAISPCVQRREHGVLAVTGVETHCRGRYDGQIECSRGFHAARGVGNFDE
jgi:hypothetical protein